MFTRYFLVFIIAIITACSEDAQFTANISGIGNDTIYIESFLLDKPLGSSDPVFDTIISRNGKFTYNSPYDIPSIVLFSPKKGTFIVTGNRRMKRLETSVHVLLEPGKKVSVSGELNPYSLEYEATGTEFNEQISALRNSYRPVSTGLLKNELALDSAMQRNASGLDTYFQKRKEFRNQEHAYQMEWVKNNPGSPLSGYLMALQNLDTAGAYIPQLSEEVRNGIFKPTLDEVFTNYRKFNAVKTAQMRIVEGALAPVFTLPDQYGNPYTMENSGKFLVLDFWGSWCGPCIKGIPDMKAYYDKYSDRMEIIGIACDDPEKNWKAAIEKYDLNWTHVKNNDDAIEDNVSVVYGVSAFPTKVIIDPDGKIAGYFDGEGEDFYTAVDRIMERGE